MASTLWLLTLIGVAVSQDSGLYELNIIHFNDFHAHFEEVSPTGGVCNPTEAQCIGGIARLATAIKEGLEAEPDSLVLNGGDTFQGTIWFNFLHWNASQHFMNLLPHDAHVLGNHEFDNGVPGLVPYLERLNAPMLGANVNTTLEPSLAPYIKNHIIIERRGRRIGIIGVLLRTFSAPIGNVIMEDEVEAVNREAAILTEQGVDIVILLSHVGYDSDMSMAARISPDVDVIVGAHSHTLLYNGETPNGDNALGAYPTVVTQSNGHRIPIVQASCYTRYLGIFKLFIDDQGTVQSWEGSPIFLGASVVQDPEMMAELVPWREEVDEVGKEVLGRTLVTLNRSWCTRRECNLGSWVCDALLEEMMGRASGTAWNEPELCIVNAGGLRVQIDPGNVTTESLLMSVPFENTIQTFDLRGEHLLETLEFSVGTFQSTPGDFYSGRMLQFGGLRVVFNASLPAGARVVSAATRCADCAVPRYEPVRRDRVYRVLSQNYIADGGSGFSVLSENRENVENLEIDYVMLRRAARRQQVLLGDLDGRIQMWW